MESKRNIRIAGFGGQGVVLSGYIVGKAAALYGGQHAAFSQSYGPEARGGACCGMVVVSENAIGYPLVNDADYFVALSKAAFLKYADKLRPGATVFVDEDLVKEATVDNQTTFGIPATRIAKEMGHQIIANVVMMGFFMEMTNVIVPEAIEESVRTTVKKAFIDLNMEALEKGRAYAREIKAKHGLGVVGLNSDACAKAAS